MAKTETGIKITPLREEEAIIRVVGDSPLIVHAWSEKAKGILPAGKRAREIMEGKNKDSNLKPKGDYDTPMEQFMNSLYWITEKPKECTEETFAKAMKKGAKFGIKAESFKAAALSAAYSKKWIPNKKSAQGLFFIVADYVIPEGPEKGTQLVQIHGVPDMREDIVRLGGISKSADLRWRPQFTEWYCDLRIKYDIDGLYSLEDIVNMINLGGHYNGIGEWRPEKGGQYGMYSVQATE
jgi:hypothetical protein